MIDLVKSFGEIKKYQICLFSLACLTSKVLNERSKLSLTGGSCVAGALSWSAFLRFVQSMQRFVPRALFKMAVPFDILSVLLGRNG